MTPGGLSYARVLTPASPRQRSAARRMAALAASVPSAADLVLVGDSLAAGWPADLLARAAPDGAVFNFGLPGDRIQNTLWRLGEGSVAHLRPRLVLVVLGTNNLGDGDPPGAVVEGLREVARVARRLWEEPDLILMTLPWRQTKDRQREAARLWINAALHSVSASLGRTRLIDADSVLGSGDEATTCLEGDGVHLNRAGHERLTAAIVRQLGPPHGS